jgi:hypothetical protein
MDNPGDARESVLMVAKENRGAENDHNFSLNGATVYQIGEGFQTIPAVYGTLSTDERRVGRSRGTIAGIGDCFVAVPCAIFPDE